MLGAVDSDGVSISQQEYTYERDQDRPGSAENIIMSIEKYSSAFMKQNNLLPEAVAAIGVALHGIIDTENGRCLLGTHLGGIIDLNLREELESVFGLPVYVNKQTVSAGF